MAYAIRFLREMLSPHNSKPDTALAGVELRSPVAKPAWTDRPNHRPAPRKRHKLSREDIEKRYNC